MNDIEDALRVELRDDHYRLDSSSLTVSAALRRRMRARERNRRRLVVAAATATVVAAMAAVFVLAPDDPSPSQPAGAQPSADPGGPTSAGAPTAAGNAASTVRGVPPYLIPVRGSTPSEALAVMPDQGTVTTFTAGSTTDPVSRVVVVAGPEETVGLVGAVRQPDWAASSALNGAKALVTDDEPTSTAFLMAFTTTGDRWFMAVTGPAAARMDVLRAIATATLNGA